MGKRFIILAILATAGMALATSAAAQAPCAGSAPARGTVIHGPILDIPDAATICIAMGATPDQWIAVSVAQLKVSRGVLMAAAFGQDATCTLGADGLAACSIDGAGLADKVRQPEVIKASMRWRDRRGDMGAPTQLALLGR